MAYAESRFDATRNESGPGALLRAILDARTKARQRDRAYRKTYATLQKFTDSDLADIGITRFMIADIAAEAALRA